ncbi:MAG: hypothetical protein JOZ43_04185 [Acidobacteriales bacterium]|nr:hypothetical protein [Terriglobales bacterium]
MADKREKRGTDESVDLRPLELEIDSEAEQNPPQQEMDGRSSRRLSGGLPYGLPTDDLHPTGTPAREVASGFSDLRRGEMPEMENDNAQRDITQNLRNEARHLSAAGGTTMADANEKKSPQGEDSYDRPTGETSRYDAEKEIPDPEQVDRDIEEAERKYGDKGNKVA